MIASMRERSDDVREMTKKRLRGQSLVTRIAFVSAVIGILFVYVHEKLGVAPAFVVGIALIPGGAWLITRTVRRHD